MTLSSAVDSAKARKLGEDESWLCEEKDDYFIEIIQKKSKFPERQRIQNYLQCKDCFDHGVFYVIKNEENQKLSYLRKISKLKNCWETPCVFPSAAIFMEFINGLIVCVFSDCTIHVVDPENGIECFPFYHLSSYVIAFSRLDFNTAGLITEDGTAKIIRFDFKSLEIMFDEKLFLEIKNPIIHSTKDLETQRYTMVVEDHFTDSNETEKVFFSLHTNSWCSLRRDFDPFFSVSNDFKAETLYELEEKANEEVMFFRPVFFRYIFPNRIVSLQRRKRHAAA